MSVLAGQLVPVNIKLEVGQITDVVEVESGIADVIEPEVLDRQEPRFRN